MAPRLQTLMALAFPAITTASLLPHREVTSSLDSITNPGFVSFPIQRGDKTLSARDATASLINEADTSYLIQLTFGSNAQPVKVAIDTGSDELFVNPNCNDKDFSSAIQQECTADGQYDPGSSSSSHVTSQTAEIVYGSGAVELQYVVDSVGIPGTNANMTNVQFGMAVASEDLNEGILGLGFGEGFNLNYSNFVDQLAAQKITNSKAFSVALGTSDTAGGSIIFGGVDTKKYSGDLISNKIEGPVQGDIQRYTVQLNSITLKNGSSTDVYPNSGLGVVLDTGSSLCQLPTTIVSRMAADFGAQADRSGLLYVDCRYQTTDGALEFAFEGITINVPFRDFILSDGGQQCVLGVQAFDSNSGIMALLGDTFLRSAYVVFDQDNMAVSLAQYVNCGTHEQPIPAGTAGASGLKGECAGGGATSSASKPKDKSAGVVTRPAAAASVVGIVAGVAALVAMV